MSETLRILVVEDNPADADFIHEMLPETGPVSFQLESVSRLSQALTRLESIGIDLVLLDLGLPDSYGLETFQKMRKAMPDLPVIVLTGIDDQDLAVAAVRDGAQDYLVKGQVGGSLLVRAARYALERQKAATTLREMNDHLELRVQERTAELEQVNRSLQAEIAERKLAEETVMGERQRLYDVLETLPVYVVLLSADYHVTFANRFFRERFGESEGRRCYEYLFHRDAPCEICETYTALKIAAPHHWEWTGPDGRNYDISDFPFTGTDSAPLILEMGIDITERKRAEEALQKAHLELEQRVAERTEALRQQTEELRTRNKELTMFNRVTVGRELRMIELKQEVNELCRRLGEPPLHATNLPPAGDATVAAGILPAVSGGFQPRGGTPTK